MSVNQHLKKLQFQHEWIFSSVSFGSVLILIGAIYLAYPGNLFDDIINFFKNFTITQVPSTSISLPAPANPATHINLYRAWFEFCLGVGVIEVIILLLRLMFHSLHRKIAENVGNLVSWFGSAYLVSVYLVTSPSVTNWFVFWAGIIMVMGLSLTTRAFVALGYRWKRQRDKTR
ncbi:MAG: hypothetical protein NWF01_01230 [Candidatus Bathyarchaeota archaeon]|nr:hypothetical protein [Candidatus Bathyarchaeota archaeon]